MKRLNDIRRLGGIVAIEMKGTHSHCDRIEEKKWIDDEI